MQLLTKLSANASPAALGAGIARDILDMLNASIRGGRWQGRTDAPAFASVLNFGRPPLAAFGAGSIDLNALSDAIYRLVSTAEPRLIPSTLSVHASLERNLRDASRVSSQWPLFEVRARTKGSGLDFQMRFRIDVTHGHAVAEH